jgi:hypothetical protein
MQNFSKEGIMVNNNHKEMNTEDPLHSRNNEASVIVKEITKDKILISQGKITEGLQHKENHSLLGM